MAVVPAGCGKAAKAGKLSFERAYSTYYRLLQAFFLMTIQLHRTWQCSGINLILPGHPALQQLLATPIEASIQCGYKALSIHRQYLHLHTKYELAR